MAATAFVPPRRASFVPVAPRAAASVDAPAAADTGAAFAVVRAAEGFDQAAFALAAALVFPALVFPYWGDLFGIVSGAALFALAFALRPAGRWAAQLLRARCGATPILVAAGGLLAASTFAIGVLPGYGAAGTLAIALLVACRTGQGLAAGACGALHETPRGAPAIGGLCTGVAVACVLMAVIASQMVHADFIAWGWRYPFCAALAVHLVAMFARVRLAGAAARRS